MRDFFRKYRSIIILVFVAVIMIVGLSFLLNNVSYSDDVFSVRYSNDDTLIINNHLPLTDPVGMVISSENSNGETTEYVEFEVSSKVSDKIKYEVYLTKDAVGTEIPPKFVKLYLTDENDIPLKGFDSARVPTYYDLRISGNDPSGKLLYSGTLKNKGKRKFRLRMWVADTYELTTDVRMFSAKLKVKMK